MKESATFIVRPVKGVYDSWGSKSIMSLMGFSKAVLKARWRKEVPGYVINLCMILWLVNGEVTVLVTGVTIINLLAPVCLGARSRREAFRSWQRSWGRRLGICKGGIEPQESPWIFLSIYPPKPESAYFTALCSHLWLYRGLSPTTISLSLKKR